MFLTADLLHEYLHIDCFLGKASRKELVFFKNISQIRGGGGGPVFLNFM